MTGSFEVIGFWFAQSLDLILVYDDEGEKSDILDAKMFLKIQTDIRSESTFKYILVLERKDTMLS